LLKSEIEAWPDLAKGALVRLLPEWETEAYPLHALLPSGRFVPSRVRAFVDFLVVQFGALMRANQTSEARPRNVAARPTKARPSKR
jgi:DNA-binding transcriptional LysR family regulator